MIWRVGVDGGGTTTRAVVINEKNEICGRGLAASSNLYNIGLEAAVANVESAISGALEEAQLGLAQIESCGLGLAGVVGETEKQRWHGALGFLANTRIVVEEDTVAAWAGAFGGDVRVGGAILIAGTGANCFGQKADGTRARGDGWGPLLGDRGSGYWIGEQALRAALAAADGAAPATLLQHRVLDCFGANDWNALVGVVYAPDFRRERVAALVPHVLHAASENDAVSIEILQNAGRELAQTALSVLQKLGIARLSPLGGLLENSALVRQSLENTLREKLPHLEMLEPQFEAVVGAALLN